MLLKPNCYTYNRYKSFTHLPPSMVKKYYRPNRIFTGKILLKSWKYPNTNSVKKKKKKMNIPIG